MKNNIFIPKEIHVGFRKRNDTYTGKLAYVIYKDEKGKLRKEKSWSGWREKDINPLITDNEERSGFVLNKKTGDYMSDWNHRQAYVRVYDPRDFEIEITIENLLYILENTSSIQGKGLEGDFVYAWDGKDLILLPTCSSDYKEISNWNKVVHSNKKIGARDLKIGATYLTKHNEEYIYMGKFDHHDEQIEYIRTYDDWGHSKVDYNNSITTIKKSKKFYFARYYKEYYSKKISLKIESFSSVSNKFIDVVNEKCVENYAELFEKLECEKEYSPIDKSKDKYKEYSRDTIENELEKAKEYHRNRYTMLSYCYIQDNGEYKEYSLSAVKQGSEIEYLALENRRFDMLKEKFKTIDELLEKYKLHYKEIYLENGKLHKIKGVSW